MLHFWCSINTRCNTFACLCFEWAGDQCRLCWLNWYLHGLDHVLQIQFRRLIDIRREQEHIDAESRTTLIRPDKTSRCCTAIWSCLYIHHDFLGVFTRKHHINPGKNFSTSYVFQLGSRSAPLFSIHLLRDQEICEPVVGGQRSTVIVLVKSHATVTDQQVTAKITMTVPTFKSQGRPNAVKRSMPNINRWSFVHGILRPVTTLDYR